MPPARARARFDERKYIGELIARVARECPRRRPTSEDEARAQAIMAAEFRELGLKTSFHKFEYNGSLYENIALHFGLGTLGSIVSPVAPLAGLALHLACAGSFWAESAHRRYLLRRVLPFRPARNVLGVMPADGEPRLRIVIAAHADAGSAGLLFKPGVISGFTNNPPAPLRFIKRGLALAVRTQAALAGIDLIRCGLGPLTWPLIPLEALLTVPSAVAFAVSSEVAVRDRVVPGAMDDLSGVAALPVLARRLGPNKRPDVEYVFVVTGCEEASFGGADALARDMRGQWGPERTVVIGLDGLCHGDLLFLEKEGEVVHTRIPAWLATVVRETARSEPRFAEVRGFEIQLGGSDVAAFLARGWEGVCLACIDPSIGAPRHYHDMTDTPENLDLDKIAFSIDFAEKLIGNVVARRL